MYPSQIKVEGHTVTVILGIDHYSVVVTNQEGRHELAEIRARRPDDEYYQVLRADPKALIKAILKLSR